MPYAIATFFSKPTALTPVSATQRFSNGTERCVLRDCRHEGERERQDTTGSAKELLSRFGPGSKLVAVRMRTPSGGEIPGRFAPGSTSRFEGLLGLL